MLELGSCRKGLVLQVLVAPFALRDIGGRAIKFHRRVLLRGDARDNGAMTYCWVRQVPLLQRLQEGTSSDEPLPEAACADAD